MEIERRPYPKQFKDEAVRLVLEQGYTCGKAGAQLGVPPKTLANALQAAAQGEAFGADRRRRGERRPCGVASGDRRVEKAAPPRRDGAGDFKKIQPVRLESDARGFAVIHEHKDEFDVSVMCETPGVSRAGYYARVDRPPSPAQTRRATLTERIRQARGDSRGLYGGPRVHAEWVEQEIDVCRNTVAKLMKRAGIRSKIKRKFHAKTTESNHAHPTRANTLDRNFTAAAPNPKWVVDITYVPTDEGFLYLSAVMDLCSRKIVGRQMAERLRTELCIDALAMASLQRKPSAGLPHHGDRGVRYCRGDYQRLLSENGVQCSMSRTGNCRDNAAMESFWGTLKRELVHLENHPTREAAKRSIFEYIEVSYNRQRRHSAIGYESPESFEASLN